MVEEKKEKKQIPTTSWGWGRQEPPKIEFLAWAEFPWKVLIGFWIAIPFYLTRLLCTGFYSTVFTFLILLIVCLGPIFVVGMITFNQLTGKGGKPVNQDKYIKFKDAAFEKLYKGKKIPMQIFHDAYINEKIDIIGDVLDTLYARDNIATDHFSWTQVRFFCAVLIPELLIHSKKQDRQQVQEHYNRGNDFYGAFLGETMIYTSAYFQDLEDSLTTAQKQKLNLVCKKVHMKPGDRHLDIGCGWGTLVAHAAANFGSDSTGVTLSVEQQKYAHGIKFKEYNVTEKTARIVVQDYREIQREHKYDKITCLEMAEHVGVKRFNSFLKQVYDMLEDDGIFYLQIAGLRRAWQAEDLHWGMFMGRYIFPGADASCPISWVIDKLDVCGFEIESVENVGIHYSATIKRWYDNWLSNKEKILPVYGQRWFRLWSFFLAWSVISPEFGMASCYQIVVAKNLCKLDRKKFIGQDLSCKVKTE